MLFCCFTEIHKWVQCYKNVQKFRLHAIFWFEHEYDKKCFKNQTRLCVLYCVFYCNHSKACAMWKEIQIMKSCFLLLFHVVCVFVWYYFANFLFSHRFCFSFYYYYFYYCFVGVSCLSHTNTLVSGLHESNNGARKENIYYTGANREVFL